MAEKCYSERILDYAMETGILDDHWMTVVYDRFALAYVNVSEENIELLTDETVSDQPVSEPYHEFLKKLDDHRDKLPQRIQNLDSFNIVHYAYQANPGALRYFAGEDFEREFEHEIMRQFEQETGIFPAEFETDGENFDAFASDQDEIIKETVTDLEKFKSTMVRKPLLQEGEVIYSDSLPELYNAINLFSDGASF